MQHRHLQNGGTLLLLTPLKQLKSLLGHGGKSLNPLPVPAMTLLYFFSEYFAIRFAPFFSPPPGAAVLKATLPA